MRKGGSNSKGAGFERKLCKELSLWVTNGERKDVFWRSSMSGGRSKILLNKGENAAAQAGDVSLIDSIGQRFMDEFSVEAKHYKSLEVHKLIWGGKGGINQFWKQACDDAKPYGKHPLLIAKQNHQPTLACTTQRGAQRLFGVQGAGTLLVAHIRRAQPLTMRVYLYEDLLQWASPIT